MPVYIFVYGARKRGGKGGERGWRTGLGEVASRVVGTRGDRDEEEGYFEPFGAWGGPRRRKEQQHVVSSDVEMVSTLEYRSKYEIPTVSRPLTIIVNR